IVGFGWFVSYAFANNWIGPVGRISMGILVGMIILVFGYIRMMKYPSQGAVFMGLGAGMAMLTIFAGRTIYQFFTPELAVGMDFLIVVLVSFASYKFNIKSLAFVAQVLAFVTPLLAAGTTNSVFLFSYLFFISLATLFLASMTGWRDLIISSLVFVGLYSAPYITAGQSPYAGGGIYGKDAPLILNFAYLFGALYLFSDMFAIVKNKLEDNKNELVLAILNGLFVFMWIHNIASKEWSSIIYAGWAIIFALSSFIAFRASTKLAPFYAYGSIAVAFLAAATAAELQGASLTIAFTMEVLLLVICVFALTKNIKATTATAWLFVVPLLLSFSSATAYLSSKELLSKDFFVLILITISLISAGRIITSFYDYLGSKNKEEANAGSVLVVIGTLYAGFIIWQFIHILMIDIPDIATMTTLIIFTILGLTAYFIGLYGNDMARRTYGMALLGFVVVRLLLIDVWHMELFGRVITFVAIGILLMSTAFLSKKKKNAGPAPVTQ
ncbi:MAG: DUF2339 domain-containing protein, partial [Candidatus Paceibacterota bacterium]